MPPASRADVITSINSGQTFLWERIDNLWYGIDGDRLLKIKVVEEDTEYTSYPGNEGWEREFFRLDDDIEEIHSSLSRDEAVAPIVKQYPGLRLLRQNPEQCLFSFICASNTNIPMIRRMLRSMSRKFGKAMSIDGHEFYAFPTASSLHAASIAELRSCGLGYRAKAVKSAAEMIADGALDFNGLRKMAYSEAREQLLKVYGIGNKIADCILLFSLDKLEAFPIDVWIARAIIRSYPRLFDCKVREKLTPNQYEMISSRMRQHFGRFAGYAQQYLYYDMRNGAGSAW